MGKRYSTEQVYDAIVNYHQMKVALGMETESAYGHVGGLVSKYDDLGMPSSRNGVSDPTFKAAFFADNILPKRMAEEYKTKIDFIDHYAQRITKVKEEVVLHWKLSGMKNVHIAEMVGITDRHVRRLLNDIACKMSEMSFLSDVG